MTNGYGYVIKPEFTENADTVDISILKGRNVASVKNSVQNAELQILLKDAGISIGDGSDEVNIVYFDGNSVSYLTKFFSSIPPIVYIPYGIALLPTFRSVSVFVIFLASF